MILELEKLVFAGAFHSDRISSLQLAQNPCKGTVKRKTTAFQKSLSTVLQQYPKENNLAIFHRCNKLVFHQTPHTPREPTEWRWQFSGLAGISVGHATRKTSLSCGCFSVMRFHQHKSAITFHSTDIECRSRKEKRQTESAVCTTIKVSALVYYVLSAFCRIAVLPSPCDTAILSSFFHLPRWLRGACLEVGVKVH